MQHKARTFSASLPARLNSATGPGTLARAARILLVLATPAAGAASMTGCGPAPAKELKNPDPSGKIPAIKQAVRLRDLRGVPHMVADLDSDDAAVRLFAIQGLRRLTGETFGYRYYDDEEEREPALKRWQEWLAQQQQDR